MLSPSQQQTLVAVLNRSSVDRAFRQQLLTNPRQALREAFGVDIPDTFNIHFIERDPGIDALIVLPDFEEYGELSERDLESVSGGGSPNDAAW